VLSLQSTLRSPERIAVRKKALLAIGRVRPGIMRRRIHAFCVGTAKSGTHSLHALFRRHYRSRHEADADVLIHFMCRLAHERPGSDEVDRFVLEREQRLRTEFHASHLQTAILPELVRLFPESRYVLPIRDCYSWLESWINHELGRDPVLADWYAWRDLAFGSAGAHTPPEEKLLGEFGLRPLRSYLRYWAEHNEFVLQSVPPARLLVLRTREIRDRVAEIARFLGVRAWTLDRARTHQFQRKMRIPLLSYLPEGYLDGLVREHCSALMERFHPELCPWSRPPGVAGREAPRGGAISDSRSDRATDSVRARRPGP